MSNGESSAVEELRPIEEPSPIEKIILDLHWMYDFSDGFNLELVKAGLPPFIPTLHRYMLDRLLLAELGFVGDHRHLPKLVIGSWEDGERRRRLRRAIRLSESLGKGALDEWIEEAVFPAEMAFRDVFPGRRFSLDDYRHFMREMARSAVIDRPYPEIIEVGRRLLSEVQQDSDEFYSRYVAMADAVLLKWLWDPIKMTFEHVVKRFDVKGRILDDDLVKTAMYLAAFNARMLHFALMPRLIAPIAPFELRDVLWSPYIITPLQGPEDERKFMSVLRGDALKGLDSKRAEGVLRSLHRSLAHVLLGFKLADDFLKFYSVPRGAIRDGTDRRLYKLLQSRFQHYSAILLFLDAPSRIDNRFLDLWYGGKELREACEDLSRFLSTALFVHAIPRDALNLSMFPLSGLDDHIRDETITVNLEGAPATVEEDLMKRITGYASSWRLIKPTSQLVSNMIFALYVVARDLEMRMNQQELDTNEIFSTVDLLRLMSGFMAQRLWVKYCGRVMREMQGVKTKGPAFGEQELEARAQLLLPSLLPFGIFTTLISMRMETPPVFGWDNKMLLSEIDAAMPYCMRIYGRLRMFMNDRVPSEKEVRREVVRIVRFQSIENLRISSTSIAYAAFAADR